MFPITITLNNQAELNAVMAALAALAAASATAPAQGGNDEGAWNTQEGYKDTAEYQAVAKAVVEVAKAQGREAAAALLEKTAGVKSLPESKPSQAAAIIAAFQG